MSDDVRVFEFKVMDIDQEHWTMAVRRCDCGGGWSKGPQSLTSGPDGPADEWTVHCPACGARAIFRFDISRFFGHEGEVERWVEERLPQADEQLRARIVRKIGPPFGTKFHSVVRALATDGEAATLLYLRWTIDRALAAMQGGSGEDDDGGPEPEPR